MVPRALITGVTGQDGMYLAEWLLDRGYEVHGATRRPQAEHPAMPGPLLSQLTLHAYDPSSVAALRGLIRDVHPREVYHLAGPSFVPDCLAEPEAAAEMLGLATLRLLEAIRNVDSHIRFLQAGSSEMFGDTEQFPQTELTPLRPSNPYGAAKAFAHWTVCDYRRRHGVFASNGILFNHESPRRSEQFVTRKITAGLARIATGHQQKLELGDLEARRDWGFAGDYVRAMHLILAHQQADDFVIATGRQHSVREFVELAFAFAGLAWDQYVVTDPALRRDGEARQLCGDAGKARRELHWSPEVPFTDLVHMMVAADLRAAGMTPPLVMPPESSRPQRSPDEPNV
jgi:GDPmannose 4,6-dehydratase